MTRSVRSAPSLLSAFQAARERTRQLFAVVRPEAYHARPIPLRHPIVFYEGHLDAFNSNLLFRRLLGQASMNPALDALFERGIDPADQAAADSHSIDAWPSRAAIEAYSGEVRERLEDFLEHFDPDDPPHPLLKRGFALRLLLEHELMHQETLLYMIHQLPYEQKVAPVGLRSPELGTAPPPSMVAIPSGSTRLGAKPGEFPFTWDNERDHREVEVPAFAIDSYPVTNGEFLEFVEAGGYRRREFWDERTWAWREAHGVDHPPFWRSSPEGWRYRGLFDEHRLPLSWPVYATHAEAMAFSRFADKDLPTEAEWQRAAYADTEHAFPWGSDEPTAEHGNFGFTLWSPTAVGTYPKGASPFGVFDLLGNGWEWTSTPFGPFPGFRPTEIYPGYSADFFDGQHMVMKGGSCFTDPVLLRRSFRNWFYWYYPYAYAGFRCVVR